MMLRLFGKDINRDCPPNDFINGSIDNEVLIVI